MAHQEKEEANQKELLDKHVLVFLEVSLVSDLTLFSRSFISRSLWDTRERSVVPEYVHSLETLACSG
jgi:hypothetical protein